MADRYLLERLLESFADPFTRADNADLGTSWTPQTAFALNLNTNSCRANAGGDPAGEYVNAVTPGTSQWCEWTITADIDNTLDQGLGGALYMATAADTCYAVLANTNASGRWQLVRRNAGSQAQLASYTGAAPANGDVARFEVQIVGSDPAMVVNINGVDRITFTDTSASKLTSGRFGAFGLITNVVARIDNYRAGEFAGATDGYLLEDASGVLILEAAAAGITYPELERVVRGVGRGVLIGAR